MEKNYLKHISVLLLSLTSFVFAFAQPDVLPENLTNEEVRDWLKQEWFDTYENVSTSTSSGYTQARLEMYNNIENENDSMYCLYSGLGRSVPTTGFTSAGNATPFDCEHIVPQSVFNSAGPMKNDIHHLTPTYSNWNSSRGNLPFDEIPDGDTEKWMRLDNSIDCDNSTPCIPGANLDEFSERITAGNLDAWEPREDAKGNVARAVFYFYTMYTNYDIDFVGDVNQLYQWHQNDPPDADEIERNDMVADFQGNQNPYIAHPDWVFPAWIDSTVVGLGSNEVQIHTEIAVQPNPLQNNILDVAIETVSSRKLGYVIYNQQGKVMRKRQPQMQTSEFRIRVDVNNFQDGVYQFCLFDKQGVVECHSFLKYD